MFSTPSPLCCPWFMYCPYYETYYKIPKFIHLESYNAFYVVTKESISTISDFLDLKLCLLYLSAVLHCKLQSTRLMKKTCDICILAGSLYIKLPAQGLQFLRLTVHTFNNLVHQRVVCAYFPD